MKKQTPREELKRLDELNGNDGFYGTHASFAHLIKHRLDEKTRKIMIKCNNGLVLWSNEYNVYVLIYNLLLDGETQKSIIHKFKIY